jgi:hypothetical protein
MSLRVEPLYNVYRLIDDQGNLWESQNGEYSMIDNSGEYYYDDGMIKGGRSDDTDGSVYCAGIRFRREDNNLILNEAGGDTIISDQCELFTIVRDHNLNRDYMICIIDGIYYRVFDVLTPLDQVRNSPSVDDITIVRRSCIITRSNLVFESFGQKLIQSTIPLRLAFKVVDRVTEYKKNIPTDYLLDVNGELWRENNKIEHSIIHKVGILKLFEVEVSNYLPNSIGEIGPIRVGFIGRDENIRITRWKLPFKLMVNSPNKPPMKSARSNIGNQ